MCFVGDAINSLVGKLAKKLKQQSLRCSVGVCMCEVRPTDGVKGGGFCVPEGKVGLLLRWPRRQPRVIDLPGGQGGQAATVALEGV